MANKPEQRHSDSVTTRNRGVVRLTEINPEARLHIGNRWVRAGDIPLTTSTLDCGHIVRGVAISTGDVIFCDKCQTEKFAN